MIQNFGMTSDGQKIVRIVVQDGCGNTASFINYGAAINSLVIDNTDVVLGYDDVTAYESNTGCLGAVMGRCTNRIKNASFCIDGKQINVSKNKPGYHIHGGFNGFNKHVWDYETTENGVVFTLESPDGDEGYPGNVTAKVTYTFENRVLRVCYDAVSDKKTVINMTNHSYFNLDGYGEILHHTLFVDSKAIAVPDNEGIPNGDVLEIKDTAFDFTSPKMIEWGISDYNPLLEQCRGYDHNYILENQGSFRHVATLTSAKSGIEMEVWTDMDCMCMYTGNWLNGQKGKNGKSYMPYSGICFETQYMTNAVNLTGFDIPVFDSGEHFKQQTEFRF